MFWIDAGRFFLLGNFKIYLSLSVFPIVFDVLGTPAPAVLRYRQRHDRLCRA